jgi:ribosome recycling factor
VSKDLIHNIETDIQEFYNKSAKDLEAAVKKKESEIGK